MNRYKTLLVGAGRMGKNHLRVVSESNAFELVGVVDPVAQLPAGVTRFSSIEDVKIDIDAAVIATPTAHHRAGAEALIERGVPLLVEKPVASTKKDAEALAALAQKKSARLVVGHVERFNPVVRKLREVLKSGAVGDPIHFSFTRVGGYPNTQLNGNNVVLDLAVHDIDIFRSLSGKASLTASVCHRSWRSDVVDTAELLLTSESRVSATIHVNWITPTKIRTIRVTGSAGVIFVDYIMQTCEMMGGNMLARELPQDLSFDQLLELYKTTDRVTFGVTKEEPLKAQLAQFAKFVREGDAGELCTLEPAVEAVAIAEQAVSSASAYLGK